MKKITEIISTYFKDQKEIIAVFLFGSFAVKRERSFSDIDIGIVADHAFMNIVRNSTNRYLLDLSRMLREDIHITILNDASENLLLQIFEKGQCLVVNDRKELSIFKMNAYSKIANFSYNKNMMQSGFLIRFRER